MTKFFFMYLVFYEYAYIGALLFGGAVTFEAYDDAKYPPLYYMMNFNDFGSSLLVLFQQMIVNNWFIVCDMLI